MKTEVLHQKLSRYLDGHSMPAEISQVQSWLSIVDKSELQLSEEEKMIIENEILDEIKAQTDYPALFPKSKPWWQKITALF
ncbi:MAG: hypothetical protein JST09_18825 [Bacteroidetes bacterium]|nr:hypothetical protein [Bacteroidota bacterium]